MEFLAGTPNPVRQLESLLAAVDQAMDGGQRVLLVGADSAAVCHWIAAACYALGPALGRQLTFATYSHDPRRCLTHVVGAIADDPSVRLDTAAFCTFGSPPVASRGEGTFQSGRCPADPGRVRQARPRSGRRRPR